MHNNMKRIFAISIGLSVVLGGLFIVVDNQSYEAAAQVEILTSSPAHGALPLSPVLRGTTMQLSIDADDFINRHNGTEIAVWNPPASPMFGVSCSLPGSSGGIKWELRADTDNDGDFADAGGFTRVQYNFFDGSDGLINIDFGDGGLVTIDVIGGATVTPAAPPGGFAWQDVSVSGFGTSGTDNTNTVGIYKFASCGREGSTLASNYQGTTTFQIIGGMIEWEKRLQSTTILPHPLQGGAIFRVTPDPFDPDPFLLVTDNVAPDVDADAGQIKLNGTEAGTFTITEETPPAGCTKDVGARMVTVSQASLNQVIGTSPLGPPPGTDDDSPGDVNERDFHNDCRGMIEWEKRLLNNGPPHPLQGGATFRITPNPFTGAGFLDVADNGVNDLDADAGQIKVNNTFIGTYTVREITPPAGHTLDPDTRTVTVTLADRNQVIGTSPLGPPPGTDDDSPGNVNERDFHDTVGGNIIIEKDTRPNDPRNFEFTETIPGTGTTFMLDDDSNGALPNSKTFTNVPGGIAFEVREIPDGDFPLQDIRCRGNGIFVRDLDATKVTITIISGTVTCTFINGLIPPPCFNGIVSPIQPEDSISMTTVVAKQDSNVIAKTVHAEKQIFDCFTSQGVAVIADVTIIAEIYENMNTQTIINKQVEVITCVKRISTAVDIDCSVTVPSTDSELVRFCRESPLEEPQEMNTVAKASINGGTNQKGIVKTIETQKEVFLCDLNDDDIDDKKVDLIVFTETWEDLTRLLVDDPIIDRTIETLRCTIKIDTVTVESCQFREFPL